jgi:hypothetical protein
MKQYARLEQAETYSRLRFYKMLNGVVDYVWVQDFSALLMTPRLTRMKKYVVVLCGGFYDFTEARSRMTRKEVFSGLKAEIRNLLWLRPYYKPVIPKRPKMNPILLEGQEAKTTYYAVLNQDEEVVMEGNFFCDPATALASLKAGMPQHESWSLAIVIPSPN